jgi:hypothetical protein
MDILDEELLGIWRQFKAQDFRYIMVGGFATSFHGYSRFTADCDVWLQDNPENRKRFSRALSNLGFGKPELLEKMEFVADWTSFRLQSGMELDVMSSLKNYSQLDFEECHKLAVRARIRDVEVPFLHINHLIAEKKASGRGKDLIDAEELERIRARLTKQSG